MIKKQKDEEENMSLRQIAKNFIYKKIRKMSVHDIRLDHLRKVGVEIGKNTYIFSDKIETNESYLIKIGDNVLIAPDVSFFTHDASACKYLAGETDIFGRITIGDNVFIGGGSIILPGVTIAEDCIIGSGSVVTKSCHTKGTVLAGNPAKPITTVEELKVKNEKYTLDFRGMTYEQKREYLLTHEDKMKKA
ncbi:MAG: acyltransferase [Clostridia bacterium]|nr:acyltransferase [Clostridia bacterium]